MVAVVFAFLSLSLRPFPAELPKDVYEIHERHFALPLRVDPNRADKIALVRLFVSVDQGNTWTHLTNGKPTDEQFAYKAPRDGLYWFSLQVVFKDGTAEPAQDQELVASMKVYVNSHRKTLKPK